MAKYVSGRQKNLKVGISSYSENLTSLEVIGKVGIGTTNATSSLYVVGDEYVTGVVTATTFYGTFSGNAATATYATNAGIATYATNAGIATYATNAGIATYATNAGIATYATIAGYSTSSGISTDAIKLQTPRTFEITGDIVGSPISFDGTGNVSIAATIQPNSVGLGTDTTGDYVQSISGTSNQISVSVTSGESTTPVLSLPSNLVLPQDVTVTRDLQVNRNLNVTGNITLGGTTAFINVQELKIADPDIVLGVRTDGSGNDISNDTTSNHGGVALASTEGTPLVDLFIAGIETNPSTYKKIMWFKSGTFAGLGTDAWLINYAVGIGSTQFPSGTRLAAGNVQFTQNDLAVVRNINSSGVITATTFYGTLSGYASSAGIATYATSAGVATYATVAGIATYATSAGVATYADNAGISTSVIGGIASVTQLYVNSGFSTFTGVTTFTSSTYFNGAYFGDNNNLYFGNNNDLRIYHSGGNAYIKDVGRGELILSSDGNGISLRKFADADQYMAEFLTSGPVKLYYNNANKFETLSVGATVTGTFFSDQISVGGIVTANSFRGSGIALTGIVTSIVAGTGITIGPTNGTGQVTIYSTASPTATYATNAGVATYADNAGISSTLTSTASVNTSGIITASSFTGSGIALTGIVTSIVAGTGITIGPTNGTGQVTIYSTASPTATYALVAGIATYATNAGVSTYADNAGIATYATSSGIATYATNAGVSTYATVAGIATYATNAGIATALQYQRTFEITGDIVGSPISFDGTGNVSIAATIQPDSVALGSDTTGDYVRDITGTVNQISVSATSGEGSTPILSIPSQFTAPQDVTVTRDLLVNRNLNVNGNITIGGTSATLFTTELKISDPDIVLGFRTDGSGNDISNDNTANHGGVALASTEGTPLVDLFIAGIETAPATYKKIMWFKSGTFAGLGTDAWLINYAVGIGSTQVPNGVRLAVGGIQMTDSTITATTFNGTLSGYATSAGISTNLAGGSAGVIPYQSGNNQTSFTQVGTAGSILVSDGSGIPYWGSITSGGGIGGITIRDEGTSLATNISSLNFVGSNITATTSGVAATITVADNLVGTALSISGISTLGTVQISSGIITATSGVVTYYGDGSKLSGISVGVVTYVDNAGLATYVKGGLAGNVLYQSAENITAFLTNGSTGTILQSNGSGNAPSWVSAAPSDAISGLTVQDEGSIVGGANSISTFNFVGENVTATASAGIATITILANIVGSALSISGISTFTNGPVLIGGGTSTGTASQSLQVTGISSNVYIGGGLGVGVTNNTTTGNIVVSGTVTANSDARLKTNVKTIENALDKVLSLRGVEYDRIDTGDHQIGLIAQEVEKIIPQVVYPKSSSPDYETKSVSYQNIVGLLIEAIKEQDKRILELERKLGEN